jgi:hypothetical protein
MVSTPFGSVYLGGWIGMPFDRASWHDADITSGVGWSFGPYWDNRRARMLGDLLSHHLHRGMTQAEVYRILGQSECGSECSDFYPIMEYPRWDQKVVSVLRWGRASPYLELEYDNGLRLEGISVR